MPKISDEQQQKMAQDGYLQCAEAARRVGVDESTVIRWIQGKKVKATNIGGYWWIDVKSLAEHLGPTGAKALGVG